MMKKLIFAVIFAAACQLSGGSWQEELKTAESQGFVFSADKKTLVSSPGNIETAVIPSCVEIIGDEAFLRRGKLRRVIIPSGVKIIGKWAFYGCGNLQEIAIPDSVKKIGRSAFMHCGNLRKVTVGSGVESIDDWAFYKCRRLAEITIPAGVKNIGGGVFVEVAGVQTAKDQPVFKTDSSGALLDMKQRVILYLPPGVSGSYTIPSGIGRIGYYAFNGCRDLKMLNVPAGMAFIDDEVFADCSSLAVISVDPEMEYFGDNVIPLNCRIVHRR